MIDDAGRDIELSVEELRAIVVQGRWMEERMMLAQVGIMSWGLEGAESARSRAGGEDVGEEEHPEDIGGSKAGILGGGMEVSISKVMVL